MDAPRYQIDRLTFRLDSWRMTCAGVLESAANTFLLLIAVRHLHLGAGGKALVAGGSSFGLLFSPIIVHGTARLGWRATTAVSRVFLFGAAACALMAGIDSLWIYVPGAVLGMASTSSIVPLMTHVYHENYPTESRGKLYARSFMFRIGGAMAFGWVGGSLLDSRPNWYPLILLSFSLAFGVSAFVVRKIPSSPLPALENSNPFHAWRFVWEDRVFRQTLVVWMFMGFANLMMIPMRVEYLGNPKYGLGRTALEIALLTTVIPNIARILMNPVWGYLFDKVNFFGLRIVLNCGFAVGILAFFTSDSGWGLVLGALLYGISNAGGDVAWGLWVTKFAPPGKVADYMGVHTFLTGVRGVLAPMAAFQLVQSFAPRTLGWFCSGLILVATILLIPEVFRWNGGRKDTIVPDEVGES